MLSAFACRADVDFGSIEPNPFDGEGIPQKRKEFFGTSPTFGNAFGRAVELVRENDRLFAALRATTAQLRQARNYLAQSTSNPILARVHLDRIRTRRSGLLAQLRSNRIEAQALLGVSRPNSSTIDTASLI